MTSGGALAATLSSYEAGSMADRLERSRRAAGVFISVRAEAIAEAHRARARWRDGAPLGPLDGLPLAVKDNYDVAGTVTTNGSIVDRADAPAPRDAAVVAALRRAGAVIVGKTTMSELAFSGLGLNPHFGTPANPRFAGEARVPGGSSSGSAIAVATGLVPLALGTDTSGSVRVPAAFCGVVGFKASDGHFSTDGIRPLAPAVDSLGVLGVRVQEVRRMVASMTTLRARQTGPPVLVVPDDEVVAQASPDVVAWFEDQLRLLAATGLRVEVRQLSALRDAQRLMDEHGTVVAAQAYRRYGHYLAGPHAVDLDPDVARRLRASATVDGAAALSRMGELRRRLATEIGDAFLVCPTVRTPPPALNDVRRSESAYDSINAEVLRTTMVLSYLGMPGISLPMVGGRARGVGVLLSARRGRDAAVLEVAEKVERISLDLNLS